MKFLGVFICMLGLTTHTNLYSQQWYRIAQTIEIEHIKLSPAPHTGPRTRK